MQTDFIEDTARKKEGYFDGNIRLAGKYELSFTKEAFVTTANDEKVVVTKGSHLTLFNTISKGNIIWQDTLGKVTSGDIDKNDIYKKYSPKGVNFSDWCALFGKSAKVVRDGEEFFGIINDQCIGHRMHDHYPTSLHLVNHNRDINQDEWYMSTLTLKKGDHVSIYDEIYDGNIVWQGNVTFEKTPKDLKQAFAKSEEKLPNYIMTEPAGSMSNQTRFPNYHQARYLRLPAKLVKP